MPCGSFCGYDGLSVILSGASRLPSPVGECCFVVHLCYVHPLVLALAVSLLFIVIFLSLCNRGSWEGALLVLGVALTCGSTFFLCACGCCSGEESQADVESQANGDDMKPVMPSESAVTQAPVRKTMPPSASAVAASESPAVDDIMDLPGVASRECEAGQDHLRNKRTEAAQAPMPSATMRAAIKQVQPAPVPQMMQVQVPPGCLPGSMIQCQTPDGQTVQVQVPAGVLPWSPFAVQYIPAAPICRSVMPQPVQAQACQAPRTLQVQVPTEASPGTTLQVQSQDGQSFQVQVPEGVGPGSYFTVKF